MQSISNKYLQQGVADKQYEAGKAVQLLQGAEHRPQTAVLITTGFGWQTATLYFKAGLTKEARDKRALG